MALVAGVKGYRCGVYESKTHSERLRPEPSSPCAVTYPARDNAHTQITTILPQFARIPKTTNNCTI